MRPIRNVAKATRKRVGEKVSFPALPPIEWANTLALVNEKENSHSDDSKWEFSDGVGVTTFVLMGIYLWTQWLSLKADKADEEAERLVGKIAKLDDDVKDRLRTLNAEMSICNTRIAAIFKVLNCRE